MYMAFPNAYTFQPYPDLKHGFEYPKDFHKQEPMSNIFRNQHISAGYRYKNIFSFNFDNASGITVLGNNPPATKAVHNALLFPEVKPVHIMDKPPSEPSLIDKIRELVR